MKVGDYVIVMKPSKKSPGWVSEMDKFDGCRGKILKIDSSPLAYQVSFGDGAFNRWWFKTEWIYPEQESCTDMQELDSFISEFKKG